MDEGLRSSDFGQDRISELKAQIDKFRQEYEEIGMALVQGAVDRIWFTTHIVLAIVTFFLFQWRWAAFLTWLGALIGFHICRNSTIRRNVEVFWTAFAIFVVYKSTKIRVKQRRLDECAAEKEWNFCHSVIARFAFQRICDLGGFWTKFGQQLSVNPALPPPYHVQLKQLQDSVPATPLDQVRAVLRAAFGSDIESRLKIDASAPPLGTASVAQVHRATWTPDDCKPPRDIVIKIQHPGVEARFRQDLWAAAIIARIVKFVDPEGLPDMRPIVAAMRQVTLNELDFSMEAANQTRAAEFVKRSKVDVLIPAVVPDLVSRCAMGMDYVDGVRLGAVRDEMPQVDCERLVGALVDHYGVQFAVDGHFHADPHPGNLLVQRGTGQLVVLDWGMCITLKPEAPEAFAKLFFATATSDVWGITEALKSIGLTFKEGDVFEPTFFLAVLRFALRDSQPMNVAREELVSAMSAGNDIYLNGPKRYQKSPVDMFTGDMVYFGRAIELLYMVSSDLGVSHSILQTLVRRSYATLLGRDLARYDKICTNPHDLLPNLASAARTPRGPLDQKMGALLREFYQNGLVLGAQLCVLDASVPFSGELVDVAVGVRGWLDHELVTPSSLFNLLDISKVAIALLVLRLMDSGELRLSDHVYEPAKARGSDVAGPTLEQVLGHLAGQWWPMAPGITEVKQLLDFEAAAAAWEASPAAEPAGRAQRYHQASFGYHCASACRRLAGRDLPALWKELVTALKVRDKGITEEDLLLTLPRALAETRGAALPTRTISSAGLEEISAQISKAVNLMGDGAVPSPAAHVAQELWGREHLTDLSLYGSVPAVAEAALPGLQAFGTARATAALLRSTACGDLLSPGLVKDMCRTRRPSGDGGPGTAELKERLGHMLRYESMDEWGLGVQLVDQTAWAKRAGVTDAERAPAWGHLSQTGSAALFLPGPRPKAFALLLNMAGGPGKAAHELAWSVIRSLEESESIVP